MEEKNSPYSTRESFISELAVAMSVYNICEDQYLNLTQQNLYFVQRENTVWDEKWPAEGDEVILVDRISSQEAFDQMVEFIDSIEDENITPKLYRALNVRHPFGAFRYAAERAGVIHQWYQWLDRWQNEQAKEWMHENGIDFKDGKIVADGKHTFVWSWKRRH